MNDWSRAISFIRALDQGIADQVVPYAYGRALITPSLPLVYDENYLIAERVDRAGADQLIAEAERIQEAAGLFHRRVNVDDQEAAARLAADFRARGYMPEHFVIMVRRRSPDHEARGGGGSVQEVGWDEIQVARRRQREQEPWSTPELIEQLLSRYERAARLVSTSYFGAVVDGQVVSSCELRSGDGIAQVETVETLELYRNRGYARAVISAALAAAGRGAFVFLVADQEDWPQHFYRRLGFDAVGTESRFLKLVSG
jgi:GNAT superfamily N-acetyltransferase